MTLDVVDQVLILLVNCSTTKQVLAACLSKKGTLGLTEKQANDAIIAARKRLTAAADYHRDEELGRSLARLNDCYIKSLAIQDFKTCLAAQKELNRLMDLYCIGHAEILEAETNRELAAIRAHLEPLQLGEDGDSTTELVRRAVAEIVTLRTK